MQQYTAEDLIVRDIPHAEVRCVVTPARAGWELIAFAVHTLVAGALLAWQTADHELAIVPLSGALRVTSGDRSWQIGGRASVFAGKPHALYVPRRSAIQISVSADCEFALAWVPCEVDYPFCEITPAQVGVEIRGGDHATRQINSIIPPGFACQRLVVVEVLTPAGNWSSYPPHKHDLHTVAADGRLVEADLEEVYYYQFARPDGFALQRVYTDRASPLARAGYGFDCTLVARHGDAVLVPEGYHPVSAAPGSDCYYLNVLAGSAQSLANTDDPALAWIKDSYTGHDPRVPFYDVTT